MGCSRGERHGGFETSSGREARGGADTTGTGNDAGTHRLGALIDREGSRGSEARTPPWEGGNDIRDVRPGSFTNDADSVAGEWDCVGDAHAADQPQG